MRWANLGFEGSLQSRGARLIAGYKVKLDQTPCLSAGCRDSTDHPSHSHSARPMICSWSPLVSQGIAPVQLVIALPGVASRRAAEATDFASAAAGAPSGIPVRVSR